MKAKNTLGINDIKFFTDKQIRKENRLWGGWVPVGIEFDPDQPWAGRNWMAYYAHIRNDRIEFFYGTGGAYNNKDIAKLWKNAKNPKEAIAKIFEYVHGVNLNRYAAQDAVEFDAGIRLG